MSRALPRRVRLLAVAGLLAVTVTGCAKFATSNANPKGSSVSEHLQSAEFYRDQAIELITDIAAVVAPGSKLALGGGSPGVSADCTAPLTGLVYYTISREFDAPDGASGASLIPAIIPQLHAHGYQTDSPGQTAGWASVTGGTDYVDLRVMGDPASPTVRIVINTRCGTPQPDGVDTATVSASSTPVSPNPST